MELNEIDEMYIHHEYLLQIFQMCHVIFTHAVNSEISTTMVTKMVEFAENGKIPFKVNAVDVVVYDNSMYDLGILDLGEFKIYDSLKTGRDGDSIRMTRFLRLTKGVGEDEREIDIEFCCRYLTRYLH